MADYGLDPSVMQYVQGGGMPSAAQPAPVDPSQYGLDPSVVSGVQNGFAPPPPPLPAAPPPPIQQQRFGFDPSIAGAPSELANQPDSVPSVTGGALSTEQPQASAASGLPAAHGSDQVIGSVMPLGVPGKNGKADDDRLLNASNKVYAAQQAQAAAFANTPEGIAQKADAERVAAIDKQRQASADAEAAASAQNAAIAKATQDSNERQAKQAAIDAAQRQKDQAMTAQYSQQYAQQIKDAADFKVNTNRDIGMSGAIAVALSGIGDAIAHVHGPNAALQIINKRIDDNIADQWAQKRALGEKANATKGLIDTSRQTAIDDRQDQDVAKAAELTDYNNQVKLIAAQSADPLQKARALQVSAGLDEQVAGITTGLANRRLEAQKVATDQANKVAERGIQWAGIKQNDVHFNKSLDEQKREHDLQRQDKLDELQLNYEKLGQKALADKAKELKTSGVFDPNTAQPLLDASAAPAIAQAKAIDAQAAAETDPAKQQQLITQAKQLRDNISVQYGATLDDKDGKLKEKLAGAQRLINTTQRIRDALEDGSITDRDTRAALKTEATNAFTAWAEANGVKASSREHEVYTEAIGALDGVSATNVNRGPLESSLKALDTGTQNLAGTILRGHGIKAIDEDGNPWTLKAEKPQAAVATPGKTSVEQAAGAEPGIITKALGVDLRHPFTSPEARDPLNIENNADTGPSGLSREDDSKVLGLIRTYGKVSPDENKRVISNLTNLVADPGDDERKQAIANSVITRVRAESPQLYDKMLEALPASRRKEITRFDLVHPAIIKGMGWTP